MGSPTSLDDWQTPLAPLADSQTLLAGLGFNTVAKTAHMSIMLLRSRAFLRACHRACYNIRHNFLQVLPYSFSINFSSPFIIFLFLFLRSLFAPNFSSLSYLAVQLPCSTATHSWPDHFLLKQNID